MGKLLLVLTAGVILIKNIIIIIAIIIDKMKTEQN